jgi:hypothetical protein
MLENTHADSMGQPLPVDYVEEVGKIADGQKVPLHIDGARIWNASIALGVPRASPARPPNRDLLPVEGLSCPGRIGRRRVNGFHLEGAVAPGSCWAAACARPASSPRRA